MTEMSESRMDELEGGMTSGCMSALFLGTGIGGVFGGPIGFIAGGMIAYQIAC